MFFASTAFCFHEQTYDEALELYARCLAIKEKEFGREHISLAITLNNMGHAKDAQDKYDEAFELYAKSLDIREKALGPEQTDLPKYMVLRAFRRPLY